MSNEIVVISKSGPCMACKQTKKLLASEGVEFVEKDLQTDPEAMALVRKLGYREMPVVIVGDTHWSGFNPDRIKALAH